MNVAGSQFQQHRARDVAGARDSRIYIPTLDGWRALAIIAVICFHGRFVFFPHPSLVRSVSEYGYLGVDAFFAISGFLICNLLICEFAAKQSIDLKAFYIRRFFRIIPPYVAALAGIGVVGVAGIHSPSAVGDSQLPALPAQLRAHGRAPGWTLRSLRVLYRPLLVAFAGGTLLPDMGAIAGFGQASTSR